MIDNHASNTHTVIEVNGRDRPGLLHDVTAAISDQGLQIASAHITTYGVRAVDVFYVKDVFGLKVENEAQAGHAAAGAGDGAGPCTRTRQRGWRRGCGQPSGSRAGLIHDAGCLVRPRRSRWHAMRWHGNTARSAAMSDRKPMPKEPDESLTSAQGPQAPRRDKQPERNYPAVERKTGVNRKGDDAPGGPVNIGVKGGAPPAGPDEAVRETPHATGRGARDAPGGLPEE